MTEIAALVPLFFVGIDWGAATHRVVVVDGAGKQVRDWVVEHTGEAVRGLVERIAALADGAVERVHVGIELKHGPLVEALLERGLVTFAVNPKQTDRFRDRIMPSGAKDDRRDAFVIANAVRTDAQWLQRLEKTDRRTTVLRALIRLREELVTDRTRLLARLREQLWRYYTQAVELADGEFDAHWFWTLLEKAPTPQQGASLSKPVVSRILRDHHIRRLDTAAVMAILKKPSLVVADGVEEAAVTHVQSLVSRLRLLDGQVRETSRQIERHLAMWDRLATTERSRDDDGDDGNGDANAGTGEEPARKSDHEILRSLPGVGPVTLATMLAELTEPLARRDYAALRALFGVAPITRQSGSSKVVSMRRACSETLRNIAFNWARVAVQHDAACSARFASMRARNKRHAHAYRAVVDHLLRVACAMLRAGRLYDPAHAHA